jgi:hypothetical protein
MMRQPGGLARVDSGTPSFRSRSRGRMPATIDRCRIDRAGRRRQPMALIRRSVSPEACPLSADERSYRVAWPKAESDPPRTCSATKRRHCASPWSSLNAEGYSVGVLLLGSAWSQALPVRPRFWRSTGTGIAAAATNRDKPRARSVDRGGRRRAVPTAVMGRLDVWRQIASRECRRHSTDLHEPEAICPIFHHVAMPLIPHAHVLDSIGENADDPVKYPTL